MPRAKEADDSHRDDFRGAQDFESVLKNFYRDTLQRIESRPQRAKAQMLVEEGLLGAAGHRLMLEERQILSDYDVTPETLQTLETSRLVRRERRLESVFYEISHDRIADSIFRGRTTKIPRKVRRLLWVAALVAVVIVTGLVISHYRVSRARDAAERWVTLLLGEEFFGELRDSGRSTVSKRLQDQIVAESKAGFGTPMTRGLALRNAGDLQRLDGTLTDALKSFRDALTELESAPRDASATREIARTYDRIGQALAMQGHPTEALQHYDSAVAAWRDVVGRKSQQVNDDCMGLAESLASAAKLNGSIGRTEVALRHNDEAFDITFGASFDTVDRCGRRPGTVQPDPDVRATSIVARIALVHNELVSDPRAVEGATVLAGRARALSPPSLKATALAMDAMAMRGFTAEGSDDTLKDYLEVLEQLRAMQLWDVDNRDGQASRALVHVLVADMLTRCMFDEKGCKPGVLDDAEVRVADAEAALRTLSGHDPSSVELHDTLVMALRTHGLVLAARGSELRAESMARFDEAERLLMARPRDPADPVAGHLATVLNNKAVCLAFLGDLEQAVATIRRLEDVLERDIAAHPKQFSYASQLHQVRMLASRLYTAMGNAAAAAKETAEAQALMARSERYKPDISAPAQLAAQGTEHRRKAESLLESDPAAALREWHASEAAFRAAIRRQPSYADGYFQLIETYVGMNRAFAKLGHGEEQLYALASATSAAQLARWLAPTGRYAEAGKWLLTTRDLLSTELVRQKRPAEALDVLEDVVDLGLEYLAEPTPDGGALGIIGDAKCRIATIQRDLGQPGWRDTLYAGLIYLRKASALDPKQQDKVDHWTRYAAEGAAARP